MRDAALPPPPLIDAPRSQMRAAIFADAGARLPILRRRALASSAAAARCRCRAAYAAAAICHDCESLSRWPFHFRQSCAAEFYATPMKQERFLR